MSQRIICTKTILYVWIVQIDGVIISLLSEMLEGIASILWSFKQVGSGHSSGQISLAIMYSQNVFTCAELTAHVMPILYPDFYSTGRLQRMETVSNVSEVDRVFVNQAFDTRHAYI